MKIEINAGDGLFIEEYPTHGSGVCPHLDVVYGVLTMAYLELSDIYDVPYTIRVGNSEVYTENQAVCCKGEFPSIGCIVVRNGDIKSVLIVTGDGSAPNEAEVLSTAEQLRLDACMSVYNGKDSDILRTILTEVGKYPRDMQKVVFMYDEYDGVEPFILKYGDNTLVLKEK